MSKFNPEEIIICIDPGHARNTPGKRAGNPEFREYAGNRRVARKLKILLEALGFKVIFSCDLDSHNDLSLQQRAENARRAGAHILISIHTNAVDNTSVRGTETFIHTNDRSSNEIAHVVQKHLVDAIGQNNRGVKRANFGVLRNSYPHMLAILTEAEFFTNPTARVWMFQESFDDTYAQAIADGVAAYYVLDSKSTPSAPIQTGKPVETDDIGLSLLRVKAKELWVYDKPDWNARAFTVKQGEAFTVVRELVVNGSKMYQLKSGLYITASSQYVEFDGKVTLAPSPTPSNTGGSYRVAQSTAAYSTASDAKNNRNRRGKVNAGNYHVFNLAQGMVNVTSKPGVPGSWINPTAKSTKSTPAAPTTIKAKDRVRVNQSARTYATGQTIPARIKGKIYHVMQVRNGEVLLAEIMSWVRTSDVTKI